MRGDASPAAAHRPEMSLTARLAALAEGREVITHASLLAAARRERRRLATRYFSCGFVASLGLGVVAMLPVVLAHPGVRLARGQPVVVAANVGRASVPLWPAHGAVAPEAEISSFELPIRHSERTSAAFPVEITGGGAARESMTVVLRDLPESTYLSKGQRQNANTWLLRPADLDNLRLSIHEGTPDAFDVTIEVATAGGDPAARSIARVRLLDAPARPEPTVAAADTLPAARAPQRTVDAAIVPRREATPAKPRPLETAPQQKTAQKPQPVQAPKPVRIEELRVVRSTRPEGMSALGMGTRELDDDRELWWRMPPSSWAGFSDLPGGN